MPDLKGGSNAVQFGIYAALAYDVMSATNSSPQTTELFANDRADTLMKYVKLGDAQALAFGLFGSWIDKSWWPLAGALTGMLIMHGMYAHALSAGQGASPPANSGPNPNGGYQ
jgi:hypothetical protein